MARFDPGLVPLMRKALEECMKCLWNTQRRQ